VSATLPWESSGRGEGACRSGTSGLKAAGGSFLAELCVPERQVLGSLGVGDGGEARSENLGRHGFGRTTHLLMRLFYKQSPKTDHELLLQCARVSGPQQIPIPRPLPGIVLRRAPVLLVPVLLEALTVTAATISDRAYDGNGHIPKT
jgi:hypothetical protein